MKTLSAVLFASVLWGIVRAQTPQSPAPRIPPLGAVDADARDRNILTNGDFSLGKAGWQLINWGKDGKMEIDNVELYEGRPTLRVTNSEACHTFVRQIIWGKPHTRYRITAFIKTLNVEAAVKGDKTGAGIEIGRTGIYTAPLLEQTSPWTKVSVEFATKESGEIRIGPTLGTDPSFVTGTAWFAELELVELGAGEAK